MSAINRLIAAGMSPDDAYEVIAWFVHHGNDSDMERYVREYELGQRQRPANG